MRRKRRQLLLEYFATCVFCARMCNNVIINNLFNVENKSLVINVEMHLCVWDQLISNDYYKVDRCQFKEANIEKGRYLQFEEDEILLRQDLLFWVTDIVQSDAFNALPGTNVISEAGVRTGRFVCISKQCRVSLLNTALCRRRHSLTCLLLSTREAGESDSR